MQFEKAYQQLMNYYMLNEHVIDEVPRKILGMSTSVIDLPDEQPYGFWVDRSGNFLQVRRYGHDEGLAEIVTNAKNYLDEKGIKYMPRYNYEELFKIGWLRIVLGSDTIMWQMGNGKPTSSQMKFMNILKEMYEIPHISGDR